MIAMPELLNAENRVLLELLETAADIKGFGLVNDADIAAIEALCIPQSVLMENAPVRGRGE